MRSHGEGGQENASDFDALVKAFDAARDASFDGPSVQRLRLAINGAAIRARCLDLPVEFPLTDEFSDANIAMIQLDSADLKLLGDNLFELL